jgi:serine/threonine protein phosphatase 1
MKYTHRQFEPNYKGRDFVVSDIHGMYYEFLEELQEVNFDEEVDRCFSVGDLIDRGSHNLECLRLINETWFYAVIGNHEDMYIRGVEGDSSMFRCWSMNGGLWQGWTCGEELMDELKNLPTFITINHALGYRVGICHAEPPTRDWNDVKEGLSEYEISRAIWGRTSLSDRSQPEIKNIDLTVHGHTIIKEPKRLANSLFIDTGSFLPMFREEGHITLLNLDEYIDEFVF